MKHVFIVDPKAFGEQQWKMDGLLDSIGQYFRTQEKPDFSTLFSHYPRDAIKLIQKQVDEAEPFETVRVYAIGGDDILFDCLNGIAGLPSMELAIAPYGITNSFIRAFGDKKGDHFKDMAALITADTIPTDMIEVGNMYAINGCSVGITPVRAIKLRDIKAKLATGISRYAVGFWFFLYKLTSLFNREIIAHDYTITIDDQDYSGRYSQINIVNAPYFDRHKNALAGSLPDDGMLDVILFKSVSPLSTSVSISRYLRGRRLPSNCVRVQARKIEVKSKKPIYIQTDTEYLVDTSITFEVVPSAVQVVAVNNLAYQGF
jgi:diacylglycerol kinase family enzyme